MTVAEVVVSLVCSEYSQRRYRERNRGRLCDSRSFFMRLHAFGGLTIHLSVVGKELAGINERQNVWRWGDRMGLIPM